MQSKPPGYMHFVRRKLPLEREEAQVFLLSLLTIFFFFLPIRLCAECSSDAGKRLKKTTLILLNKIVLLHKAQDLP